MAEYELTDGDGVTRGDGASIPEDDNNRDWRAYQEWLSVGNTPDPIPTPVIDPAVAVHKALENSARVKIATTSALTADEETAIFGDDQPAT